MHKSETIKKKKKKALSASLKARAKKTAENKLRTLKCYRESAGIVTTTCSKANIAPETFYAWLRSDPAFKEQIDRTEEVVVGTVKDFLMQKIFSEKDLTAMIFYLKNKSKEFQQERMVLEGKNIGNGMNKIVCIFVKPGDKIPKELIEPVQEAEIVGGEDE